MSAFDAALRRRIVGAARLAPSAHNTQPVRWHFGSDGVIALLGDTSRRLPCADPHDRDFALSCGAALEATALSLGAQGIGVATVETYDGGACGSLRTMARLATAGTAEPDPLSRWMDARHTWRAGFGRATRNQAQALQAWASQWGDVRLATAAEEVSWLARLNDRATVGFLRDAAWRAELCDWMRLRRRHPAYARDGMNREALAMSALEAAGAGAVLGGAFDWLDRMGLATTLVGERPRTRTSTAIVLLHRSVDEAPLHSGRVFYRRWLELTSLGLAAWPMSAAVDDAVAAGEISERFAVPAGHRLLAALRVGPAQGSPPERVRLPIDELIAA